MFFIDQIAERRIQEAIDRGELEDLPGSGKPLKLDDNSHVPVELRVAHRILKNANFLPPELELRKQIHRIEDLLVHIQGEQDLEEAKTKLGLLKVRLDILKASRN